jgi:putative ABC transport system substrate-binding protein
MRRREFITIIAGAAALPLAVRAQQPAIPVVGWLNSETPSGYAPLAAAFRQGLSEAGLVEGRNVAIEYHWAEGHNDRLPALAADLVRRQVAVIAAAGTASALAAKAATTTIPIVFSTAADPVAEGLVTSLSRPGGNATGVTNLGTELVQKQIEMLHQMVPKATVIGALVNPAQPSLAGVATKDAQTAARTLGLQAHVIQASNAGDIDAAFATLVRLGASALLVCPDAFFLSRRGQIAALAIRHTMPTIYYIREFPAAGGLMSYGTSSTGRISPGWRLRRANSQGRATGRSAGAAVRQVRARHQSQHRQGARPRRAFLSATARRRGDRIAAQFAAVHKSAYGTSRQFIAMQRSVAIGVTADICADGESRPILPFHNVSLCESTLCVSPRAKFYIS